MAKKTSTKEQKGTPAAVKPASKPRVFSGIVTSDKMKDTIVVRIDTYEKHPKYGKFMSRAKKFKAHDAGNTKKIGDKVSIQECRPISKDKHFTLVVVTAETTK